MYYTTEMIILRKSWELILDIFFPSICLGCKKYLENEEKDNLVCAYCLAGVEIYKTLFYQSHGVTLAAASSYKNTALRELIHCLKYNGFLKAGKPLGEILIKYLSDLNLHLENSIVVPIPLYPSRKRKRGFNQAEILAEIVSKHFGSQLETNILKRVKETKPQIELHNYKARRENLKNSFSINKKLAHKLKNKRVLLVDDVYTSGSTMNEAAKALILIGVKEVIGLTVVKAD